MKYNLRFGENFDKSAIIFTGNSEEECYEALSTDCATNGKDVYYTRHWKTADDITTVDYGSWSTFYFIEPVDEETISENTTSMNLKEELLGHSGMSLFNYFTEVLIPNHIVLRYYENIGEEDEYADYIVPLNIFDDYSDYLVMYTYANGNSFDECDKNMLSFISLSELVKKEMTIVTQDQFNME